jgi:hypothetical protein
VVANGGSSRSEGRNDEADEQDEKEEVAEDHDGVPPVRTGGCPRETGDLSPDPGEHQVVPEAWVDSSSDGPSLPEASSEDPADPAVVPDDPPPSESEFDPSSESGVDSLSESDSSSEDESGVPSDPD